MTERISRFVAESLAARMPIPDEYETYKRYLAESCSKGAAMTYTVWVDNGTDGWYPNDDLSDLAAVLHCIHTQTYGHDYRVTRDVNVVLTEANTGVKPGEVTFQTYQPAEPQKCSRGPCRLGRGHPGECRT